VQAADNADATLRRQGLPQEGGAHTWRQLACPGCGD
jgi:hypothetical protein